MLKYSVAIAALLLGAPVAFAQGAGDKTGGGAGMSNSGPSSSRPSSSGSSSSGLKSGGGSAERSGAIRCERRGFRFGLVRLRFGTRP